MTTITMPRSAATGPSMREGTVEEAVSWTEEHGSRVSSEIDAKIAEKARKNLRNLGQGGLERTTLLGLLLARLEGVDFDTTCTVLDVRPARLERMMHGEDSIPKSYETRWALLAEAFRNLHLVLNPSATARWLGTSVPDLAGNTPLDAIKRNQVQRIVELTRSYRDPSFS